MTLCWPCNRMWDTTLRVSSSSLQNKESLNNHAMQQWNVEAPTLWRQSSHWEYIRS